MTRRRRGLLVTALTGLLLVLLAGPASAQVIDACKADPPMSSARSGVPDSLDPGPVWADSDQKIPDAENPGGSWYLSQGYGGLTWINYDPGCARDKTGGGSDPEQSTAGWVANLGLQNLAIGVAALGWLIRLALNPATLALLDPFLAIGSAVFGGYVFLPALAVVGSFAGLWFIARSAKDSAADTLSAAGTVIVIVCVTLITISFPLVVGHSVDKLMTTGTAAVFSQAANVGATSADLIADARNGNTDVQPAAPQPPEDLLEQNPADQIINAVHRGVLYQTWRAGVFGRDGGPAADKYGPCLFANSTLTYAESTLPAGEREDLIERKGQAFNECADQFKADDPVGYRYLAGHENNARLGYVTLGWATLLMMAVLFGLALFRVFLALVTVRAAVIGLPLIAVVALWPPLAHYFWKPLDFLARTLILGFASACIAALYTAGMTGLLSPTSGVDALTAAALMLTLNIALLGAMRKAKQEAKEQVRTPRTGRAARAEQEQRTRQEQMPAEGRDGGFVGGTVGGAVQGGMLGVMTGGPGGAAAGALRGAAVGGTTAVSARAAGSAGPAIAATVAAGSIRAADAPTATADPSPQLGLPAGDGTPPVHEPDGIEVYRPDEAGPAVPTHQQAPDGTYEVWTPTGATR